MHRLILHSSWLCNEKFKNENLVKYNEDRLLYNEWKYKHIKHNFYIEQIEKWKIKLTNIFNNKFDELEKITNLEDIKTLFPNTKKFDCESTNKTNIFLFYFIKY